jgi:signal transduction histidine kinase
MLINAVNIPTSFVIIGFLYLILPIMTWIVLNGQRSSLVSLWCGGGLSIGSGLLLISLRGFVPDWATFLLANLLIFTGYLFRIQSLRLHLTLPSWPTRWMVFAFLMFIVVFESIHLGLADALLRTEFVALYNVVMNLMLSLLAWRIGRRYGSPNASFIFVTYLLGGLIMMVRLMALLKGEVQPDALVANIMSIQAGIIGLVGTIATHFGYIGMTLDHLVKNETKIKTDKLVALRQSQQVIAQLDRQRSLGALSASLGHEINQPLTAILANAQIAKRVINKEPVNSAQLQNLLDKIIHNTRRANLIIERIRSFIKPANMEMGIVKVGSLVRDTAQYIKEEAMIHHIAIVFDIDDGELLVKGDVIQLSQVLLNLFRNGIEVLKQNTPRRLTISVKHIENVIVTTISDTGSGLSEEALERVGEAFYTTKADGLGLGLSISKSIIESHHGQLLISNNEEGGACFKICLPAVYHQGKLELF